MLQRGPIDPRRDLFGGSGEVRVSDLLAGAVAPPFTAVLSCQLEAGGTVGIHRQLHFPEVVIGLSGSGEATVDGDAVPLDPGCVVHLPLGSLLAIRNRSSTEPLDYLIIKARP